VKTKAGRRICQRLLKHWSHRFDVKAAPTGGTASFGDSTCDLIAEEQLIVVTVHATDEAALLQLESVVAEHLQRMAPKETLSFPWTH
jgi:hypothetical protein